jgi:hypothetical protein
MGLEHVIAELYWAQTLQLSIANAAEVKMPDELIATHGVMEGQGAYNKHAKIPAGGASLALPLLEKAVEQITIDAGNSPLVIADYGSSQGKNSLLPMGIAIKKLRSQVGLERPIFVFHVDQSANDFTTLFEVVDGDPNTYALNEPNVFPCAIGRSFYKNVLPPDSVHLGWSSYAAVWLSQIPTSIPGHFVVLRSTGSVREAFDRQAAQDWEAFLRLRANELRPGGRMVIVLPAVNDDGWSGFEDLFDHSNAVLADLVWEGTLSAGERARMVLGTYPRRKCDLLAPFDKDGQFQGLIVEDCELSELEDAAWNEYQRNGDTEALANTHALFFRSIFIPSLSCVLHSPDEEKRQAFAHQLQCGLKRRLMDQPAPLHSLVATVVLAKQDSP